MAATMQRRGCAARAAAPDPAPMKPRALGLLALAFVVASLVAACATRLAVPDGPAVALPEGDVTVSVDVIDTGGINAIQALAVEGGGLVSIETTIAAVLVRHPDATFLVDAGFGQNAAAHFKTTPIALQIAGSLDHRASIVDELRARDLSPGDLTGVLLTHAHWDHVSGLEDMKEVPVYMHPAERAFIDDGEEATSLVRPWVPELSLHTLPFDDGPALGFDESEDVFGDGAVIAVRLRGHTPGSIGVLLRVTPTRSALLLGDVAWLREGVLWPAQKSAIARTVEHDPARVREALVRLHRLARANPELLIVPAHDRAALDELDALGDAR